ncbi:hypothetical protein E3N88_33113 [Mikania micrantha]|uniref:Uncharacterized protein n=1 Tax=Mikania micrantha TaxID=192012 RepID=A0A5N6MB18_9ASTR|nr:hypothetical protein E3N88_33113 [Mikania micrantha]
MDIESPNCGEQHVVTVWEIKKDRFTAMQRKLSDTPKLLTIAAGQTTCSIFKIDEVVEVDDSDPLLTMPWILSFFLRDLIRLENQIPFFVLERLFDLTKTPESPKLVTLALNIFNLATQRPENVLETYTTLKPKHLLDLLRSSFIPPDLEPTEKPNNRPPPHIIRNISKLKRSGIKLKPLKAESFLMVNFKRGVIHMPMITIDDFMCAFLLNAVAFEQCHNGCSKIFTTYVTLLDCLINTSRDVGLLSDWNIIENYLGTEAEVATFFNNMGRDVSFDINVCYLARLFDNVNRHHRSGWHVQWASLKYTYFNTPWSFISALAASVLLVLTVAQTVYTILSYTASS